MEIINLTSEQNNALINLAKANIPFMVTGRYSYESTIEPSDIDLLIPIEYNARVNTIIDIDNIKVNEGSKHDNEKGKERIFYKNKIDILYISDQSEWDEYITFSRVQNGICLSHPAHSMLAKLRMIMKTVNGNQTSSFKHSRDLEEYIRKTLETTCEIDTWICSKK